MVQFPQASKQTVLVKIGKRAFSIRVRRLSPEQRARARLTIKEA